MKLICFSNNTGGGLLCDLLNNRTSDLIRYSVAATEHNVFKVGDTPSIQNSINKIKWNDLVKNYYKDIYKDIWFGTHTHPSCIPDLSIFNKVIAITTETRDSKIYRWLRYYHGWFKTVCPDWIESDGLDKIDKIRCLAKNVLDPFEPHPNCINIEFADIVSGKYINENKLNIDYFNIWKERNPWLYTENNESWAVKRFNEAEYEIVNKTPYRYI